MSTGDSGTDSLEGSDDAPVLVDVPSEGEEDDVHVVTPEKNNAHEARALQIVSVGTEEDAYAFSFLEENLNSILSQIPAGWKVAVVSVVGAFRTGKSFLLSWFLRYLHYIQREESSNKEWYKSFQTLGNDGFDWRGGAERNTTGIWMWSRPHYIDKTAVLLVDTQGMFDNETTMSLTASIFGLSTLLSSYQIYNVDKRIQEDNLQQLALFSEYARMAMKTHDDDDEEEEEDTSEEKEEDVKKDASDEQEEKPFQRMEFLVRDWQHFDEEDDLDKMEEEMRDYLEKVISERNAKDLQETREQILGCFGEVSCFAMTHPGMAVTKKKYTGDVSVMEDTFLQLLDRYCVKVFNNLPPKKIRGRELSAVELGTYIKAYAELFSSGAHFPEAATLLEATASANNTNAIQLAMTEYKERMNRIAGPRCSNYVRPEELNEMHADVLKESMEIFESIATFGPKPDIEKARHQLTDRIGENYEVYTSLNDGRNPLAGLETVLLPITVALVVYIVRLVLDLTCSHWSTVCKGSSEMLSHLYAVVICFMLIIAATKAKQISEWWGRMKAALELVMTPPEQRKPKND